jgi:5'-3' exonuclease
MIVLFDLDALIYQSCYRICDIADIKKWLNEKRDREWMEAEIVSLSVNRLNNMVFNVFEDVEETGIEITEVEYYITTCKNSIRKKYYSGYKASRSIKKSPMTKWVSKSRTYIRDVMNFAIGNDEWEADDLIADRAKELGLDRCIVLSVDKDLKTIGGLFFDYYEIPALDEHGNKLLDEYGNPAKRYRGLSSTTAEEANRLHFIQTIMGDSGDDIAGANGIGESKATKIIDSVHAPEYEIAARNAYYESEIRKLKSALNKRDAAIKKLSFAKFIQQIDDGTFIVDTETFISKANYNYTLNKFLVELGTKRSESTYKTINI